MANKMLTEEKLRDEFLSAIFQSEDPQRAPAGFTDGVMDRIASLRAPSRIKPYAPPKWLKWGVPGIILTSLLTLVIWGSLSQPDGSAPGLSFAEKVLKTVNAWFSDFSFDIQLPHLSIPDTYLWILVGGMALIAGFAALYRFLEKREGKRS
jgi:hypothetical protein